MSIDLFCLYLCVSLTLVGAVLAFIKLQRDPKNMRWSWYLLVCAGTLFSGILNGGLVFGLRMKLPHQRLDLYAFAFDNILGQPSFALGRVLLRLPWLRAASMVGYKAIYATIMLIISWYFLTQEFEDAVAVAKSIFLSQLVVLVYIVIPVSGPRYVFPNFPASFAGDTWPHVVSIDAVPNGVPSGHLTIALLVAYFARRWPVGKALGALNLILTVSATLGEGEHYAFDLLAEIPFTAFLLYVSDNAFADWGIRFGAPCGTAAGWTG